MRRTPWPRLVGLAVGSTAVSFGALRLAEGQGATVLPLPWITSAVILGIAVWVGILGWHVRQYTRGRRPQLDALVAARTVVLATASAHTGALLAGWYGAHVLLVAGDLDLDARRDVATSALAPLGCAVLLVVVGLVVERWCEVRREDDDDPGPGASAASGSTA